MTPGPRLYPLRYAGRAYRYLVAAFPGTVQLVHATLAQIAVNYIGKRLAVCLESTDGHPAVQCAEQTLLGVCASLKAESPRHDGRQGLYPGVPHPLALTHKPGEQQESVLVGQRSVKIEYRQPGHVASDEL